MNGKNYCSKVKGGHNDFSIRTNKANIKMNYTLKPGWKISSAYVNGKKVTLKNGKSYPMEDKVAVFILVLENKRNGAIVDIGILASN